jgi:hypothetical protein
VYAVFVSSAARTASATLRALLIVSAIVVTVMANECRSSEPENDRTGSRESTL